MFLRKCLCAVLLLCVASVSVTTAYASGSNVTLVVEGSEAGGGSGGTGGSGGSSSGGSGGGGDVTDEKPDNTGESETPAGGQDGSGDDYYLRHGIDVDTEVREHGYIIGKPQWVFAPDSSLTRAEFATILDRIFIFENESTAGRHFDDVVGHWAEDSVCRLAANGVVLGVNSHEFCPDSALKRDEGLLMLSRILDIDRYEDSTSAIDLSDHYAKKILSQIINAGVYSVLSGDLNMREPVDRDEMIHVVNNIIYPREKDVSEVEDYLEYKDVFNDLLRNKSAPYYENCLKAIDKNYLISKLGG